MSISFQLNTTPQMKARVLFYELLAWEVSLEEVRHTLSAIQKNLYYLRTLTFKIWLYSIMDSFNTIYSVNQIHCRSSGKNLSLITYGKLFIT